MTDLLRAVAGLPQSHGGLSVSMFGDQERVGFCLARADGGPEVAVAMVAGARFAEAKMGRAVTILDTTTMTAEQLAEHHAREARTRAAFQRLVP